MKRALLIFALFAGQSAEAQDLATAVSQCWIVDPGADWGRVSISVQFELDAEAKVAGELLLLGSSGSDEADTRAAFDAARRAVLRCQNSGYLGFESKTIQLKFSPVGGVVER